MSQGVINITDENFEKAVAKGVSVIDFWAPWCGPCRMQGPIVEQVEKEMEGKTLVGKMNVDENPKIAGQYGIFSIPTLIIMKDGKSVKQFVGVQQKETLIKALNEALQN